MRLAKFTDLADVNPPRKKINREPSELTSFVPMECVDENTGTIAEVYNKPFEKISKGYTYFENGDIIFAKITPCMENGKSAIVENLKDGFGFGSTEFIVIRPKKDVYRRWLYQFVRSKDFRLEAEAHFTGSAGQQRVPVPFIENKYVPIPEYEDKIDGIISEVEVKLAHVEAMRQSALKQKQAAKALQSAILREVFAGSENLSSIPIKKTGKIITGYTPPRGELDNYGGQTPWIKPEDLDQTLFVSSSKEFISKSGLKEKRLLPINSILVSCIGNIGKMAIAGVPLVTNQQINSVIPNDDIDPLFLYFAIKFAIQNKKDINIALVSILNAGDFGKVAIPYIQGKEKQKLFAENIGVRFRQVEVTIKAIEKEIAAIEALPAAILREAFNFK